MLLRTFAPSILRPSTFEPSSATGRSSRLLRYLRPSMLRRFDASPFDLRTFERQRSFFFDRLRYLRPFAFKLSLSLSRTTALERKARPDLQVSRVVAILVDEPERRVARVGVRVPQHCVVQRVDRLHAELQLHAVRQAEVLEQPDVEQVQVVGAHA